jgi:hypothetical protein
MSTAAGATSAAPAIDYRHAPRVPRRGRRPWTVIAGIAGTVVISLLAISLLYYKWYANDEYTTTIIVWGFDSWDGARVSVTGTNLPKGELEDRLSAGRDMLVRFHVPPGDYVVNVTKDGKLLAKRTSEAPLKPNMIWWAARVPPPPTTRAAAP